MPDSQYDSLPPLDPHETVARVLYASQAHVAGPVYAEMESIRASALQNNVPLRVHTALLHQSGWFVQWKEGPGEALRPLMDRVARDRRHSGLRIVHASRGPRLLAGPWSMAIVANGEPPEAFARRVHALRHHFDAGRQDAPPAAWRRLSTPMDHAGAHLQADPDVFQRVLVCAAQGTRQFDLVAWLARSHRQPIVHRRFAGARDLDVGTDYVDFQGEGRMLRVIAMARRGLGVPLTRAFLPDYSHLLLLLAGEPHADMQLVLRMAQACSHLRQPPVLLAVAADGRVHEPLARLAARSGLDYCGVEADPCTPAAAWPAALPVLDRWQATHMQPAQGLEHALAG